MEHSTFVGQTFGKLTVLYQLSGGDVPRNHKWTCRCTCGAQATVYQHQLLRGNPSCRQCTPSKERLKTPSYKRKLSIVGQYKKGARIRQKDWSLTDGEAMELMSAPCKYCGRKPDFVGNKFAYNGIDRVNNKSGYVTENVAPCCSMCNYMKSDYSEAEFLQQVESIYNHQAASIM